VDRQDKFFLKIAAAVLILAAVTYGIYRNVTVVREVILDAVGKNDPQIPPPTESTDMRDIAKSMEISLRDVYDYGLVATGNDGKEEKAHVAVVGKAYSVNFGSESLRLVKAMPLSPHFPDMECTLDGTFTYAIVTQIFGDNGLGNALEVKINVEGNNEPFDGWEEYLRLNGDNDNGKWLRFCPDNVTVVMTEMMLTKANIRARKIIALDRAAQEDAAKSKPTNQSLRIEVVP
jgi:hypothetical protein